MITINGKKQLFISNVMILESKDDMKKRRLKSPDRADAFVLTFGEYIMEPDEHIMTPMIGSVLIKR